MASASMATSSGGTNQVSGKSGRNKGHKFSAASAAPGGDTCSSSSTIASQYSSQSGNWKLEIISFEKQSKFMFAYVITYCLDKSRRSSQHSASSGFHSENSGNQQHHSTNNHHNKDSDGHKEKSSKRRCHASSQNASRTTEANNSNVNSVPIVTVVKEESISTDSGIQQSVSNQQSAETCNKRYWIYLEKKIDR